MAFYSKFYLSDYQLLILLRHVRQVRHLRHVLDGAPNASEFLTIEKKDINLIANPALSKKFALRNKAIA